MSMELISDLNPDKNTKETDSEDERGLITFVQRVKLAVAVAVIRSTPKGVKPEDHATMLVQTFSNDIDSWKSKCQKLEEEMFNLEQKLQTMEIKSKINSQFPGYDTWQDSTTELSVTEPISVSRIAQTNIKDSVEFVRNFILLDSVSTTNCLVSNPTDESDVKRSAIVLKSTSAIFSYLKSEEGLRMEFDIVKKTMAEVHRLLNSSFAKLNNELISLCLNFVDFLLIDIHKTLEINKVDDQHRRSSLIQMIAEHKSLTVLILCRLLREITVVSDFLEGLFRPDNEDFLPLLHAENIYYVLQSIEGVLKIMEKQNSSLNALRIPEALLIEWEKTTKNSLSVLGTHFPMYCIYVWHLKSIMKSLLVTNHEKE
ncbi:uncharacterized protein TNCT_80481 [Trichonephila clavata]|uniref:Uncharacterized protein n=1 Tax=Trichonephila clavata TaxID=2740835 RepID=A0A8X6FUS2_TRICU|nr:uncharacterized protein TNCT_80481 [Trichonephila clavata]